jgi:hypothetical protein
MRLPRPIPLLPLLLLGACASVPPAGPTVFALPPEGKDLQRFQAEDAQCRNYAFGQIGYAPAQAGANAAVGSGTVGTALGAAAGALIGSASGQAGAGAAIGAGTGLVAGTAVGAGNAAASTAGLQARYDAAYAQCMASAGNRLPSPPQVAVLPFAAPAYPYPYAYPQPYPYPYAYPYYWGPRISLGYHRGFGHPYYRRPYPGWRW